MDLGKKWQADEVYIYDVHNEGFSPKLQEMLYYKLTDRLWHDDEGTGSKDAALNLSGGINLAYLWAKPYKSYTVAKLYLCFNAV